MLKADLNVLRGAHPGRIRYAITQKTDYTGATEETIYGYEDFTLFVDGYCKLDSVTLNTVINPIVEYELDTAGFDFASYTFTQTPDCLYSYSAQLESSPSFPTTS